MKKRIGIFSSVFFLIAILTTAGAPYPPPQGDLAPETHRYGMNAGIGALDWDPAEMFADAMKTFREVTRPDGSPVAKDSQGWPTEDCRFLVWHGLAREAGTYHLKFTGQAASILADGAIIQNIQYSAATNTTTANVIVNADYLYLTFTGTSSGVKDAKLMLPGHAFSETWNRDFLAALAPIPVIRFMDFTATNWNHDVNWSDRPLPNAATQQSHPAGYGWQGKGIAWEYAIDLMNVTNKDGWINIPAEANDAYVAGLIDLIQNGANGFAPLEAERKLYIEYSNEVWNGMFDQAQFNHDGAVTEVNAGGSPLNFDGEANEWYWAWRRVGKRIVEISGQFRAAFGDAQMMTRFRPVLAWQYNDGQATASQQLDFIAKYYGTDKWGYADPHPVNYYLWCGGGALYYDDVPLAQDLDFQAAVQTDSKLASAFGIHYCNYEGGMYFDGQEDPDWFEPWVTTYMLDHHKYYEEHGGSLLMYFTLAATWENGLGFVRTIRDLNTRKYSGILQLSQQAGLWKNAYGSSLPMHVDGGRFTLIGGDWESPHAGAINISPNAWRAYHFDADYPGEYKAWLEFTSTDAIHLNLYAGSDLLATISADTGGATTTTAKFAFTATEGLHALRILNLGGASFQVNAVHVASNTLRLTARSTAGNDGWALESGETTNSGGTVNSGAATLRLGDDAARKQYRSILSFNTASLPDTAIITKVTLKIRVYGALVGNNNPFTWGQGLKVDVCKGTFGTSALQLTDFNFNNATNCRLLAGTFASTPTSGWYSVTLISAARSKVNPLGLTQFRLRFYKDDNDDNVADYWRFYSGNYATATLRPTLIIEYYVP